MPSVLDHIDSQTPLHAYTGSNDPSRFRRTGHVMFLVSLIAFNGNNWEDVVKNQVFFRSLYHDHQPDDFRQFARWLPGFLGLLAAMMSSWNLYTISDYETDAQMSGEANNSNAESALYIEKKKRLRDEQPAFAKKFSERLKAIDKNKEPPKNAPIAKTDKEDQLLKSYEEYSTEIRHRIKQQNQKMSDIIAQLSTDPATREQQIRAGAYQNIYALPTDTTDFDVRAMIRHCEQAEIGAHYSGLPVQHIVKNVFNCASFTLYGLVAGGMNPFPNKTRQMLHTIPYNVLAGITLACLSATLHEQYTGTKSLSDYSVIHYIACILPALKLIEAVSDTAQYTRKFITMGNYNPIITFFIAAAFYSVFLAINLITLPFAQRGMVPELFANPSDFKNRMQQLPKARLFQLVRHDKKTPDTKKDLTYVPIKPTTH